MAQASHQTRLLKAQHVADTLALPVRAVYVLVERGELPAYRLGRRLRFSQDEVQRFLDDRREHLVVPS